MKLSNKAVAFVALSLFASTVTPAHAKTVQGDFVGCSSEESLYDFTGATKSGDYIMLTSLLNSVCTPINDMKYSVIGEKDSVVIIKVRLAKSSVALWTTGDLVGE